MVGAGTILNEKIEDNTIVNLSRKIEMKKINFKDCL